MKERSKWITGVTIALVILVGVRMSLPYVAQWYVNRTLGSGNEYTGQVGDIDLMLWRGAYSFEDVLIKKRNGLVDEPLFRAEYVEFSLLWSALFQGKAVGDVTLVRPEVNFVDAKDDARSQSGVQENWLYLADQIMPLQVDRLEVKKGKITFHNPDSSPEIHISLHDIEVLILNLVNSRELAKDLAATFQAEGQTAEQGRIEMKASLDPNTPRPTFDLNVQASDVALVNFKNFLDTYAPFDLEAGSLEMAVELASDNGKIKGYAKPILHHVEVFSWKGDIEEDGDGFFKGMVEMVSAFIAELFENQSKDQIATRIPIEGEISDPDTAVWPAIGALLKNAFIAAIKGNLENSVDMDDVSEDKSEVKAATEEDEDNGGEEESKESS